MFHTVKHLYKIYYPPLHNPLQKSSKNPTKYPISLYVPSNVDDIIKGDALNPLSGVAIHNHGGTRAVVYHSRLKLQIPATAWTPRLIPPATALGMSHPPGYRHTGVTGAPGLTPRIRRAQPL